MIFFKFKRKSIRINLIIKTKSFKNRMKNIKVNLIKKINSFKIRMKYIKVNLINNFLFKTKLIYSALGVESCHLFL